MKPDNNTIRTLEIQDDLLFNTVDFKSQVDELISNGANIEMIISLISAVKEEARKKMKFLIIELDRKLKL